MIRLGSLFLFVVFSFSIKAQDVFAYLGKPRLVLDAIFSESHQDLPQVIESQLPDFEKNGFQFKKIEANALRIGNTMRAIPDSLTLHVWQNVNPDILMQVLEFPHTITRDDVGRYYNLDGWFTNTGGLSIQIKSDSFSTLTAKRYQDNLIFSTTIHLPYPVSFYDDIPEDYRSDIHAKTELLTDLLSVLASNILQENQMIYAKVDQLSSEERLFGFVHFWTEVKYNFAFFDQVPELDWDQVLIDWIPKISKEQTNEEYYDNLSNICALLRDGHTNIYPPPYLSGYKSSPLIELKHVNHKAIVVGYDSTLSDQIQLGAEVLNVDGEPTEEYLKKHIFPSISSSTEHIRWDNGVRDLLKGPNGSSVQFGIKNPDGSQHNITGIRTITFPSAWHSSQQPIRRKDFQFINDDIAYIQLNSFGSNQVVDYFESKLDSIQQAKALIIDLRRNGGGNSNHGYNVLKYFTDQNFLGSKWKTREHKAAFKAWGQSVYYENRDRLEEVKNDTTWNSEALNTYLGEYWYESDPRNVDASSTVVLNLPVVVLTSHFTASAAEDFLVASDTFENFTIMGQKTFGSTGQPSFIRLPGGGSARVCTKKDTYPDGREFVGYGIQPDFEIPLAISDALGKTDSTFDEAVKFLIGKL